MQLLSDHDIHLWRFNLQSLPDNWQSEGIGCLSVDENQRAERFTRGRDDYINSRIFMRKVLSEYLDEPADLLEFNRTPHGKPFLLGEDISFNLSHSRQWVVLAVGLQCDLGVDVESVLDRRSIMRIANHYFHEDEIFKLQKITNPQLQQEYFFQLWTLKESCLKALGKGISAGLDKVRFTDVNTSKIRATFSPALNINNPNAWQFFQQSIEGDLVKNWCAVTVNSPREMKIHWCN